MQFHGVGMPSNVRYPQPFQGAVGLPMRSGMAMPMRSTLRPQPQLWQGVRPRMQGRVMQQPSMFMMPASSFPTALGRAPQPSRLITKRPITAAAVRRPIATTPGIKKLAAPEVAAAVDNKSHAEGVLAGVKRKLSATDPSTPSQPSKFVRGPGSMAIPKLSGLAKSVAKAGIPKPAGAIRPPGRMLTPTPTSSPNVVKKVAKAFPMSPKPKASVESKDAPREAKNPEIIKADVKMRKVEAFTKHLLDEWSSLSKENKETSWDLVTAKFKERVAPDFLAKMADCFTESASAESHEEVEAKQELTSRRKTFPPHAVVKNEAEEEDEGDYTDSMQQVFFAMSEKDPEEMNAFWTSLKISPLRQASALTTFLQIVIESGEYQTAAEFLQQLTKARLITVKNVESALSATAKNLEDFIKVNESAWHMHAHVLMRFFPKSIQSSWGFTEAIVKWSWLSWWEMTQRVLGFAHSFQAFDILVLVLQMMQEHSGLVIREQPLWKHMDRIKKVQDTLCTWGEMDEKAINDTLTAYGVEL